MSGLLAVGLGNAASASMIALLAAGASRVVRNPSLVHGLWLLVLLDLLTPPLLVIGVLPARAPVPAETQSVLSPAPVDDVDLRYVRAAAGARASETSAEPSVRRIDIETPARVAWIAGAAIVLLLALVRGLRFERLLRRGVRAPEPILARTAALARALGLARCPPVRLVSARVSPLLWFRPGRMEIVLPARLVARLETEELDALLAHELAHVRRGDHWVRWIELASSALFFWHPVVWWARARMRSAEEHSCDAWVASVLPSHARAYAGGLVKALQFLAASRGPAVPALASGVAQFRRVEERLTMILNRRTPPVSTPGQRMALAVAGLVLLVVFPGAAKLSTAEAETEKPQAPAESAEAAALEAELEELERRRMELDMRLRELYRRDEQVRLGEEISRLSAAGRSDEARRLETRAEQFERQAELEREQEQIARRRYLEAAELDSAQAAIRRERELALAEGRSEEAEAARLELEQVEEQIEAHGLAFERKALAIDSRAREAEIAAAAAELEMLERQGRVDEARRLEDDLSFLKLELERAEAGRHARIEQHALEHEARQIERRAEAAARGGDEPQAEVLQRTAEEMRHVVRELDRSSRGSDLRARIVRLQAEIEQLLEMDGGRKAEVDALRRAIEELERSLERAP